MKKFRLSWDFFHRPDKESLEKWRHLEFAMRKPIHKENHDYEIENSELRFKKNEIYFKNWNAGL